jgi:hypothetical protein
MTTIDGVSFRLAPARVRPAAPPEAAAVEIDEDDKFVISRQKCNRRFGGGLDHHARNLAMSADYDDGTARTPGTAVAMAATSLLSHALPAGS